jgi:cation transport ATPase
MMLYQVVHSTLGRYRICIPKIASDSEFASKLKNLIESFAFVTEVRLNAAASSLIVNYKARAISETIALEKLVGCIYQADGSEILLEETPIEEADLQLEYNQWQDLGLPVLSLSLSLLAAPLEIPTLMVMLAIAGASMPWLNRATDSLWNHRQPSIDLMDWVWMAAQTLRGQYAAPALKTVMVETRRTLRGNTTKEREQEALKLLDELNQSVRVERDGQEQWISIQEVCTGDRVIFKAGDRILVDGQILKGVGAIDLQPLIGETAPFICTEGEEVYASTILLEGQIWVLVKRTGANTRVGLAAGLMQLAPVHDTEIGARQAELARSAVLPTLAFGGAFFALTGNIGAAISPYQLDFGSGIPISLSTTVLQALTYAARHGIYIRSGRVLELLAEVDTIVFERIDALNPEDSECVAAIASLHDQNINTYLIDSASQSATLELALRLGIPPDQTHAEATPTQKSHLVRGLCHQGKTVAFVTSEVGETKLDRGHVSIVFANNTEIPDERADIVILNDDIRSLTHAIAIAKRAISSIYENTAIIVIPNLLMQIGGGMILGWHPVSNVIVNNGSAIVAEFFNSPRPLFETSDLPLLGNRAKSVKDKQTEALPAASNSLIPFGAMEKQLEKQPANHTAKSWLKQRDLAKRLGVASQLLTRYRIKPNFSTWTQAKDPDGIAWSYDLAARCYRHSLP